MTGTDRRRECRQELIRDGKGRMLAADLIERGLTDVVKPRRAGKLLDPAVRVADAVDSPPGAASIARFGRPTHRRTDPSSLYRSWLEVHELMSTSPKFQLGRVDFTPADLASIRRPKHVLTGPRPGMVKKKKPVIRFEKSRETGPSSAGLLTDGQDGSQNSADPQDCRFGSKCDAVIQLYFLHLSAEDLRLCGWMLLQIAITFNQFSR
jgi:hypothetical protein